MHDDGTRLAARVATVTPSRPVPPAALSVVLVALSLLMTACTAVALEIVVGETGEAAVAQPMIAFAIEDASPARRDPRAADGDEVQHPALAVLDTGSSTHLLSSLTAEGTGVRAERGGRFVEVGLTGEHPMTVSRPYGLALPAPGAEARSRSRPRSPHPTPFRFPATRFLLQDAPADLVTLLTHPAAAIDVIGMPAIRELVVTVDADESPPVIALRGRADPSAAELWAGLQLRDFSRRRHPDNRGPLPALAANPTIVVGASLNGRDTTGDWLVDTGAAVTILGVRTARALGVGGADGEPTRPAAFSVPVSGISGTAALRGFRLDRIEIATLDGRTIVFPKPAVVVHDVATTDDDGTAIVLDGILGMNLLLASGSSPSLLGFAVEHRAPFERIVIDVPRSRLGLTPR